MTRNYQNSLFTELTDAESATVNGGSVINGISGSNSDINGDININGSSQGHLGFSRGAEGARGAGRSVSEDWAPSSAGSGPHLGPVR